MLARRILGLSLALVLLAGSSDRTCRAAVTTGATRVELPIDEARANRSVSWPVTTGVPFPKDRLTREDQCRLVDDLGHEQTLQTRVAATWDAARTSIRWLTIDFIAEPGRTYALEFGPAVQRAAFPEIRASSSGAIVVVETGPMRVEFSRSGPAALAAIRVDLNGDGQIAADERLAGGAAEGDHLLVDRAGETSTGARDGAEREITVERSGPVRACVRVDGWYTSPSGKRTVRYRARYHLFAGLSLIKLVDEFGIVESTRGEQFADIALPLELNLNAGSRRVTVGWEDSPGGEAEIDWGDATRSVSLAQQTHRHYGNPDCRAMIVEQSDAGEQTLRKGQRAGAWLQAADDRAAVTGSLRWFWQQFPKEWELTENRLVLHLWSPRGGALDFGEPGLRAFFGPAGEKYLLNWQGVREPQSPIEKFFFFAGRHALERDGADGLGINKHHEAWFHFGPAAAAAAGREYGALADQQPLCLATGEWNCSTDVFGPLAARPNDSPYEAIVDRLFGLERYAQDAFGDYGWWLFGAGPHYSYQWDAETQRHYADPRRFEYHTYQRETQLWWCYFRSGERKFYDWALPSENHWVDVAVAHAPTKFTTQWRGGAAGEATLHFPAGDWSIDSPLHYVRHHDTGEAWLRSASQFWATYHRTLETTTLAYYLTGDERYADAIDLWRDYWSPLAGTRSDSAEVQPWHREQLWFAPTGPGETSKTWAEMLRDYAPFQSGSRHQMTLLFNLATLYEHTWDPAIGQVAREFADAYLAPDNPNGVWQCQDHRLPANADSPMLAHYWSSALWKHARATGDPRMPGVLQKYFAACYEADPYAGEVGVYSNAHIAWGWYFTRDPRLLVAARRQLDEMLPVAAPLARPEDLGPRIYNPYDPVRALTAVPRLIGALEDARRLGVDEPPQPPLAPQRALIALHRKQGEPLRAVAWGWDAQPEWLDAAGNAAGTSGETFAGRSHLQPFDRTLPGYRVYRTSMEEAAGGNDAWRFLSPKLETGLLELKGVDAIWCWAGEPLRLDPGKAFWWRRNGPATELVIESALASQLKVSHQGQPLSAKAGSNALTVSLTELPADAWLEIGASASAAAWFRIAPATGAERWVSVGSRAESGEPPSALVGRRERVQIDRRQTFVPGKFGQGLLIVPGRELRIRDEGAVAGGETRRLSDPRQGTIEFWIRWLVDERLTPTPALQIMENGTLQAWRPSKLPLDEWAHVAVVWRPVENLPDRALAHIYVDGRDHATYRNLYWAGYAAPPTFNATHEWRKQFVVRAPPGVAFVLDDIRISSTPRYADLSLDFGPQQTFNPVTFAPPAQPAGDDNATIVRLPLDGDATGTTVEGKPLVAEIVMEPD